MKPLFVLSAVLLSFNVSFAQNAPSLESIKSMKNPGVYINNREISESDGNKLLEYIQTAEYRGLAKAPCIFRIKIRDNDREVILKSDGFGWFAFVGNDLFYKMNKNLTDFIDVKRIVFLYDGDKYILRPTKKDSIYGVLIETEFDRFNVGLTESEYAFLFSAKNAVESNNADIFIYYSDNEKIGYDKDKNPDLYLTLTEAVKIFNLPNYTVQKGDTLNKIVKKLHNEYTKEDLIACNRYIDIFPLQIGQRIKLGKRIN